MDDTNPVDWQSGESPKAQPIDIKVEATQLESSFALLSAPSTSYPRSAPYTSASGPPSFNSRQRSNSSLASPRRIKPYPSSRINTPDSINMTASTPYYSNWPPAPVSRGARSTMSSNPREIEDEGRQMPFKESLHQVSHSFGGRSIDRGPPSSSSSLTGAMGNTHMSFQRHSASPPRKNEPAYQTSFDQSMNWTSDHGPQSPQLHSPYAQGVMQSPYSVSSTASNPMNDGPHVLPLPPNYSSSYSNHSSGSISSPSPPFSAASYENHAPQPHRRNIEDHDSVASNSLIMTSLQGVPSSSGHIRSGTVTASDDSSLGREMYQLRKRVRELELVNEHARDRIRVLEEELAHDAAYGHQGMTLLPSSIADIPQANPAHSAQSHTMQASWKARTNARIRMFCSLNRAGNALCAWHDSRRERRAHPPRMAPPGTLNCGCTYEEALFEESLARHGVGSYHPGESVRMDPALRNPLLRLLQSRYGYRDGDFERDPHTGEWVEGEGQAIWEQRAHAGVAKSTRPPRVPEMTY